MKIRTIIILLINVIFFSNCDKTQYVYPKKKEIIDAVFANGYIKYTDEYWVTSNVEGFLIKSLVDEGDSIENGHLLFQLSNDITKLQKENAYINYQDALQKSNNSSPQIIQLKNQIAQSKISLELDKKNFERNKVLIESNAISQLDFEKSKVQFENSKLNLLNLEKSLSELQSNLKLSLKNTKNQLEIQEKNLNDYKLKSMSNGIVLEVKKNKGELIKKGETIARIGSGKLTTLLYVAEEDINRIKIGQEAILSLNTEKNKTYNTKVSKIYPAFDETEQSFKIEVTFIGQTPLLKSGTQVQANIITDKRNNALVIPREFLFDDNLVLLNGGDTLKIKTGVKTFEQVEIISGINEQTKLILPKQ